MLGMFGIKIIKANQQLNGYFKNNKSITTKTKSKWKRNLNVKMELVYYSQTKL